MCLVQAVSSQLKEAMPMRVRSQLRWISILPAVCFLVIAATLTAGGFYLSLEEPAKVSSPQTKDAVLLVRLYGCQQPEDALISATAEGLVKGLRETINLKLLPVSKGVYAIQRQWPKKGAWLVAVRSTYLGAHRAALLELPPDGTVKLAEQVPGKVPQVKTLFRELLADDIDAALLDLPRERLAASQRASN
jgi:hypothetical protein